VSRRGGCKGMRGFSRVSVGAGLLLGGWWCAVVTLRYLAAVCHTPATGGQRQPLGWRSNDSFNALYASKIYPQNI